MEHPVEQPVKQMSPSELKQGEFIEPRHWIGAEELTENYWTDAKILEKRGQEFFDKPVETIEMIERLDTKGFARRDFMTIMGASMAMTTFACARRPVHKIIPYVVKPEEVTPGEALYYATYSPETGEPILAKTREGRPIKLEGNPDFSRAGGALSARTQASVLDLYDPDRVTDPVRRGRVVGQVGVQKAGFRTVIDWKEVDQVVSEALTKAVASGGKVRVLTGELKSATEAKLIHEFVLAFAAGKHVEFSALGNEEIALASEETSGQRLVPHYHFEKADALVSIGADFLATWGNASENAFGWSAKRKLEGKPATAELSKFFVFESGFTVTGANADQRYPIRAGDELAIALAIAHELIVVNKLSSLASDSQVVSVLNGYRAEVVAAEIGLADGAASIKAAAHALLGSKGKSLVVSGGLSTKTVNAVATQVAVNLLNHVLENEGSTINGVERPLRPGQSIAELQKLIEEMKSGAVDVLIIQGANPAYSLPASAGFIEALSHVGLVVCVSTHENETALLSDLTLPDVHFLENWGDAKLARGVYALQQPTLAPIHRSRSLSDSLLVWGKSAGLKLSAEMVASATFHEYLKAEWKATVYKEVGSIGTFEQFWESSLRVGVVKTAEAGKIAGRSFKASAVAKLPAFKSRADGIYLSLYSAVSMGDGAQANNAWLQEMPDPISTITWDNYLSVGPSLAKKLNLVENDVVEVSSDGQKVLLPVWVQPGIHPSSVSVAIGFGRRNAGRVGNGTGWDVLGFSHLSAGQWVFSGGPVEVKKIGRKYNLAKTQWHHTSENRPIVNDITLAEYKRNPATANHTDPHLRLPEVPTLWSEHRYKGYRWGMSIDLSSCTGCGACVVACQAENNIPVVGRDNVRVSREMHWIRIDRYYSGSPERPDVVFLPMLCQHCENAPCETVCPVLATVHSDEGLNEQTYNRCVGTRYCQNNCPYKVRRFNFFDHWKAYEGTANMVWNPDVTVRTRGIMEKCTFCVQRIQEAKNKSKEMGGRIKDGQLKTACQQTCPTEAIVFGDINDRRSEVSKNHSDPRAFKSLEVINVKPVISYLTKVRNKEPMAHAGTGKHETSPGHG